MAFDFDPALCANCPYGLCVTDFSVPPTKGGIRLQKGRTTKFGLRQGNAINCTMADFVPGFGKDPIKGVPLTMYSDRIRDNMMAAGDTLHPGRFAATIQQVAKVTGDSFELLEASVLWNVAAAWNTYMTTGTWPTSSELNCPSNAVPDPSQRVAFLKLPRNYDATLLYSPAARAPIVKATNILNAQGMRLGLAAPDIVAVRLPTTSSTAVGGAVPAVGDPLAVFDVPLSNIGATNLHLLESAFTRLVGSIGTHDLLCAIAVKSGLRSDRLYLTLLEANVLKYLTHGVLGATSFVFYAHTGAADGCDPDTHYRSASIYSLANGGTPAKAVDHYEVLTNPKAMAQRLLDDLVNLTVLPAATSGMGAALVTPVPQVPPATNFPNP